MDASKLMELMKQKKASMQKRDKTVKVKPGKNRVVLLPGWRKGEEHVWFHDFGQHFIKNAADEIQAVHVCLDKTYGRPCSICEGLSRATHATTDDSVLELLGKAKASATVLINALMLDGDEPNTPVILEIKRSVFGQIVELIEEWGAEAFSRELVIVREGKGLNTKYSAQITPKQFDVPPAALTKLNNLDEYVRQENEEQQRRALSAISAVAGLLPAGSDRPKTAAPKTAVDEFEDVPDLTAAPTNKASAEPISAGGTSPSLADELDDLLADIEK